MNLRHVAIAVAMASVACLPSAPVSTTAPPEAVFATVASPNPSTSPPDALGYFKPLLGYGWVAPPSSVQSALETSFSASALRQVVVGVPVIRIVTMSGGPTDLALMGLVPDPAKALVPTPLDVIVKGYGGSPGFITISGTRAAFLPADARRTSKLLLWQQRQFVLVLIAVSLSTMDNMTALARLLIDANGETRTV